MRMTMPRLTRILWFALAAGIMGSTSTPALSASQCDPMVNPHRRVIAPRQVQNLRAIVCELGLADKCINRPYSEAAWGATGGHLTASGWHATFWAAKPGTYMVVVNGDCGPAASKIIVRNDSLWLSPGLKQRVRG